MMDNISKKEAVYLGKEILCRSLEGRPVYLITITSETAVEIPEKCKPENNQIIFPEGLRSLEIFAKPAIIITARVHPGEASSSFAMEGMLKFLMSNDLRAHMLRSMFQFVIVPMLNPDGVYNGFYRTDTMGNNLNRFYLVADEKQYNT